MRTPCRFAGSCEALRSVKMATRRRKAYSSRTGPLASRTDVPGTVSHIRMRLHTPSQLLSDFMQMIVMALYTKACYLNRRS